MRKKLIVVSAGTGSGTVSDETDEEPENAL
jgi:hypothetical protein